MFYKYDICNDSSTEYSSTNLGEKKTRSGLSVSKNWENNAGKSKNFFVFIIKIPSLCFFLEKDEHQED